MTPSSGPTARTITLSAALVENNAGTNGFAPIGPGGASPSTATFADCNFLDNLAQGGAQGVANGGAIVSEGNGTSLTLTNCQIIGNQSLGGAGATAGEYGQGIGGGLALVAGTTTIAGSTISDNQAVGGKVAVASDVGVLLGSAYGGGIENQDLLLTITNSTISGNSVQGGANADGPGTDAFGGGIDCSISGDLNVTNSQILDNSATAGRGGAGTALGTSGAAGFAFGGGIDTSNTATTSLVGCTIAGNVAQGSRGAQWQQRRRRAGRRPGRRRLRPGRDAGQLAVDSERLHHRRQRGRGRYRQSRHKWG